MPMTRDTRRDGPPPAVAEALPRLLRGEVPEGVETLKAGVVFRVGGFAVKFFPRATGPLARLRQPRALRAIRNHARLLPVRSPLPLHWERLRHERFESLLVSEFVEGPTLLEVWRAGAPEALAALPRLFADLHGAGVLHADLHAKNLIWSSSGWCILDLESVRHGLHALRRRTITENIWARLMFDFDGDRRAAELYREFLHLAGRPWEFEPSWERVLRGFDEVLRKRGLPGPTSTGSL